MQLIEIIETTCHEYFNAGDVLFAVIVIDNVIQYGIVLKKDQTPFALTIKNREKFKMKLANFDPPIADFYANENTFCEVYAFEDHRSFTNG